ncbi:conserved hypothetical protein [Methanocaldococcus vulcanius M7]|uniref:Replication protein A C-terminal domain-containing protein n=1 Tax=Methanocaldococcus vulcanius (strain ATCC 700851 / DSM 12094 / M7) TaxID=579137 RepID=C9RH77_METVM|nr:winged helix-turn-helix transcriptional regulator [Methanocaldococcus vulcanius]ACX72929.1 conserved hypothetical protein [Methanocaldococcus vulcanius M7]
MRYVAYKIYPEEFLNNEVVDNALILEGKKLRRVRILGRVENVNVGGIISFYVDGVNVRYFEEKPIYVEEGDVVDIIGRPKTYNGEKYLMAEIVKRRNEKWTTLRNLEIKKTRKYLLKAEDVGDDLEEEVFNEITGRDLDTIKNKILEIIKERGEITYEDLVEELNISEEELENCLSDLINSGDIFEPRPHIYKVL